MRGAGRCGRKQQLLRCAASPARGLLLALDTRPDPSLCATISVCGTNKCSESATRRDAYVRQCKRNRLHCFLCFLCFAGHAWVGLHLISREAQGRLLLVFSNCRWRAAGWRPARWRTWRGARVGCVPPSTSRRCRSPGPAGALAPPQHKCSRAARASHAAAVVSLGTVSGSIRCGRGGCAVPVRCAALLGRVYELLTYQCQKLYPDNCTFVPSDRA